MKKLFPILFILCLFCGIAAAESEVAILNWTEIEKDMTSNFPGHYEVMENYPFKYYLLDFFEKKTDTKNIDVLGGELCFCYTLTDNDGYVFYAMTRDGTLEDAMAKSAEDPTWIFTIPSVVNGYNSYIGSFNTDNGEIISCTFGMDDGTLMTFCFGPITNDDLVNFSTFLFASIQHYEKTTEPENADILYFQGLANIVMGNEEKAAELFQKAAELGNAAACNELAVMYEDGSGVKQSYEKAAELYQKAAELGDGLAKHNLVDLGESYEEGNGVEQSYEKAAELYQKAADLGVVDAIYNLGVLYEKGNGVKQSNKKAAELYQKAADLGNNSAKNKLSQIGNSSGTDSTDSSSKKDDKSTEVSKTYTPVTGKCTANKVNVRREPSMNAGSMGQINRDDRVTVLENLGEWSKISCKRGEGYIKTQYIQLDK